CGLLLGRASTAAAQAHAADASPLLHSTQLIVVTTAHWSDVNGTLRRYERPLPGAPWRAVGNPVPVVLGSKGLGWGIGAVALSISKKGDPVKQEGDLKAPAGIFHLGTEFGDALAKPTGWQMPYLALTPTIECVDDTHSSFYNRIVNRSSVAPDWHSSEHMLKVGKYYRWGVEVEQNPAAQRSAGSCVFMHIWDGKGVGTEGCTAMAEPQIKAILAWLRPAADALVVQMPSTQYRQLEKQLHLPAE
ncbi:MAG TPA: hypothetical protein VGR64_09810, partial [Terracidiphilus sp.]|nr:hypothetical protein [Terracidiphilus sp.]